MTRAALCRFASFARLRVAVFAALAVFLAVLSSGAPELIELAVGDEPTPCATRCDFSGKGGDCSPVCRSGACARVAPAFVSFVAVVEAAPVPTVSFLPVGVLAIDSLTPSSGVGDDVFHPPRV